MTSDEFGGSPVESVFILAVGADQGAFVTPVASGRISPADDPSSSPLKLCSFHPHLHCSPPNSLRPSLPHFRSTMAAHRHPVISPPDPPSLFVHLISNVFCS
jgi:hypothetical protein